MRKHGRTDSNQTRLVKAARELGATVAILSSVGGGVPDLLIGCNGVNVLVEVKDGDKPPSKRKLTKDEQRFHDDWRGQVCVVESVTGMVVLVQEMRDARRPHTERD